MKPISSAGRFLFTLGVFVSSTAVSNCCAGETLLCTASLTGVQEVPPIATEAQGILTFTQLESTEVILRITHTVASPLPVRLYSGAPGENGAEIDLHSLGHADNLTESPIVVSLSSSGYLQLIRSPHYLNLPSAAHPDGEIRGDLVNCTAENLYTNCNDETRMAHALLTGFSDYNPDRSNGLTLQEILSTYTFDCFTLEQFQQWDQNENNAISRWELAQVAFQTPFESPPPLQKLLSALGMLWVFFLELIGGILLTFARILVFLVNLIFRALYKSIY